MVSLNSTPSLQGLLWTAPPRAACPSPQRLVWALVCVPSPTPPRPPCSWCPSPGPRAPSWKLGASAQVLARPRAGGRVGRRGHPPRCLQLIPAPKGLTFPGCAAARPPPWHLDRLIRWHLTADPELVFNKLVLAEPPSSRPQPLPRPGANPKPNPGSPGLPHQGLVPRGPQELGCGSFSPPAPREGPVESGEAAAHAHRSPVLPSFVHSPRTPGKRQGPPLRVWHLVGKSHGGSPSADESRQDR